MRSDPVRMGGHHVLVADQTVRVLRLLALLTSARSWRGEDLAARLGVTVRTVRRPPELRDRCRGSAWPLAAAADPGGALRSSPG
jgi:HTH domain